MTLACASCGEEVAPAARFCGACGSPQQRRCHSCGAEQPAAAAFCSACGATLREGARRAAAGDEREERRIVSVLFADLAGSTALGEQLDPEDVRELQGELFELVNSDVERFGGVTEKFIGDAVLAVFGIPQAHEDDPERAVSAALAVRDAFGAFAARIDERHGAAVGLRIGVNTGEVVSSRESAARGELMVSGDVVNVAARLQQAAEPGQVIVGDRTRAATSRLVDYDARGGIEAKGKSAPVNAWVARGLAARPARRGIEGLAAPIIGRDEELAVLTAVAARVVRERVPQLVTLFGHAGVGKSRLLAEFVDRIPDVRLLKGRCLPYGDGITYWPLAEVAKSHAGILETDSAELALEKLQAAVGRVVSPDETEGVVEATAWTLGLALPGLRAAETPSASIRARLYGAWTRYVAGLGREHPTVLAIEDIHWASEPLLDLLDHLADALDDASVLIVCPARPELLESRPAWGAGKQNAIALNLSPLSPSDSRRLVSELLDADRVLEEARQQILASAEGNPFYLEEILRMLIEEGAIERQEGGWVATERLQALPIPDSVHGVIAARVDLLDAPARDALRRCSVMGRTFWPAAVKVEEGLVEALGRRGLVSERPSSVVAGMREFVFKHALTRDVAYQTLPRPERRELHRTVGEWIEKGGVGRGGETAEIAAYHLVEARRYGDEDPELAAHAFALLLESGESAIARAAVPSAAGLFERALSLAADERSRCLALFALARTDVAMLTYDRARERLIDAEGHARADGDPLLVSDVLGALTRMSWLSGQWDQAMEYAGAAIEALAGLPESPALAAALARRSQLEMLRGEPAAEPHALAAIEVASRVGDVFAEVNGTINLITARAARGVRPDRDEAFGIFARAIDAGLLDEAYRLIVNFTWSASPHEPIPEVRDAVAALADRLAGAHAVEFDGFSQYLALSRAKFFWIPSGDWDRVDVELEAASQVAVEGSNWLVAREIVVGMALRRGDVVTVDELLPEWMETAIASHEPQRMIPMAAIALARAALAGDAAGVRDLGELVLAAVDDRLQWAPLATAAIPRAIFQTGDLELLRRIDEALATKASTARYAHAVSLGFSGLRAVLEGRPDEALAPLQEAVALEQERKATYSAACAELDVALALDALGDADGAAGARSRAGAVLAPLGCVNAV